MSLEGNTFRNLAAYFSFIIWSAQQKYHVLQVSPRKNENLISRGPNRSEGAGEFFEKNKRGGGLFGTEEYLRT